MDRYDHICSIERFSNDTAQHQLNVLRDDGVYRHLRFKQPDSTSYYFDLITWPGHLAITGDMGGNLFCRREDMFEFFRTDRQHSDCSINPGYWSEKLVCRGERDATEEWSVELHNQAVQRLLAEFLDGCDLDEDERDELRSDVELFLIDPMDKYEAVTALRDWRNDHFDIDLMDFPSCKDYGFHFIWRCRAIAWGIQQYDLHKQAAEATT